MQTIGNCAKVELMLCGKQYCIFPTTDTQTFHDKTAILPHLFLPNLKSKLTRNKSAAWRSKTTWACERSVTELRYLYKFNRPERDCEQIKIIIECNEPESGQDKWVVKGPQWSFQKQARKQLQSSQQSTYLFSCCSMALSAAVWAASAWGTRTIHTKPKN